MNEDKPSVELGWAQIAKVGLASEGISTGLWRIGVKIRFAGMTMQFPDLSAPDGLLAMPVAASGIEGIALFPADEPGPMVFDAAELSLPKTKTKTPVAAKSARALSAKKR